MQWQCCSRISRRFSSRASGPLALVALAAFAAPSRAQFTIFQGIGKGPSDLQATVDDFRSALGNLNANVPLSFPDGRREINWDAVPDSFADPNPFPGNFFNGITSPRARGIQFSTPGTGFLVSASSVNPTNTPPRFGFTTDFFPFSEQRMFAPIGSVTTDVRFFLPSKNAQGATVSAFGAVFEDVNLPDVTRMDFFDQGGNLLLSQAVPTLPNGMSFLGVQTAGTPFFRVRITTGDQALLGNGQLGSGSDTVVMDDFIFKEQTLQGVAPEPGSLALVGFALIGAIPVFRHRIRG